MINLVHLLSINVRPKPTVSRKPNFDKMFLGESVTFTCAAGAFSGWEYLWYHDGKEIQAPKTDVYTIDSVDHSYSGEYSCKAKRGKGPFYTEESETQSLLVPDFAQMYVGEKVNFTCKVDVSSGWNYKWYINGTLLPSATSKTITSSLSDGGKYSCKATRGEETSTAQSAEIQQDVHEKKPKPLMTQEPKADKVYVGESVSFVCEVDVSSGWEYHWSKDGIALHSNSNVFKIRDASSSDNGNYECVAKRDKSAYHTLNSDRRSLQISGESKKGISKVAYLFLTVGCTTQNPESHCCGNPSTT
uniref:Ig-like domain-containing protein n=1 Tax=Scophthalmus maximus TaxID=52904 RepID=A0A8D3BZZ1_SCOMX